MTTQAVERSSVSEVVSAAQHARRLLGSGNLLKAFDVVKAAQADGHGSPELDFVQVLILARLGETDRALALHESLPAQADEDVIALRGRLLKDLALTKEGSARAEALRLAQQQYRRAFDQTGGSFSGINAATMAFIAGETGEARDLAKRLLDAEASAPTATYWQAATRAEALLLLDWAEPALLALEEALQAPDCTAGARASTLRQLQLLAASMPGNLWLNRVRAKLRPAPVLFWSGHMFAEGSTFEGRLKQEVAAKIGSMAAAIGYGALAAGSDILVAEAMLEAGGEIDVVLPFPAETFRATSIDPFGPSWRKRFDRLLAAASSVTVAAPDSHKDDPGQFAFGSEVALGLAMIRADNLLTDVSGLCIWDGQNGSGQAGTGADVARLSKAGLDTYVIPFQAARCAPRNDERWAARARSTRSFIFTDFAGFSGIKEEALPSFWRTIMAKAAATIDEFGDDVDAVNSWGDAIFVVVKDPVRAALLALRLKEACRISSAELSLAREAGMRIAAHAGPAYLIEDPVTRRPTAVGSSVTLAARIEPVAPIGSVFVTGSFAALVRLSASKAFTFSYMGQVPLAKGHGETSIFEIRNG